MKKKWGGNKLNCIYMVYVWVKDVRFVVNNGIFFKLIGGSGFGFVVLFKVCGESKWGWGFEG